MHKGDSPGSNEPVGRLSWEVQVMNTEMVKQAVVRILREGATGGTGFLVTSSGHILTCWHVVEPLLLVRVLFEGETEPTIAHVCKDLSNFEEDIVVLKVDAPDRTPLPLGLEWSVGDEVWTYGYQYQEHIASGYPLKGKITGEAKLYRDQQMIVVSDTDVQRGLSGAPLLNLKTNKIVGMINAKFDDKGVGFAIPISTVVKRWPEL